MDWSGRDFHCSVRTTSCASGTPCGLSVLTGPNDSRKNLPSRDGGPAFTEESHRPSVPTDSGPGHDNLATPLLQLSSRLG